MSRRLHALYRYTERIKIWFSARFTDMGRLFILFACVAFLFGLSVQSTMIYQIFGAVFALIAFSFAATLRCLLPLVIVRRLPDTCVAGREIKYVVVLENTGRRKYRALYYNESMKEYLPDYIEFVSSKEEGEDKRNVFDRKMRYYRWLWLLWIGRRCSSDEQELPEIEAGKKRETEMRLMPLQRGIIHIRGYTLTRRDPFGLCKYQVHHQDPHNLMVFPRIYHVPRLFFHGSRRYHQGGITAAMERGDSTEFLSLREYSHGDPIKHIDWKSTARSGRTIVKQYRDEYFSRYGLVLDSFTAKRHCSLFEEAVSVAASVLMAQDSEDAVLDLLFVGSECVTCTIGRGLSDQQRMMKILASVSTCRDKGFHELAGLVKSHSSLLSGVVLVFIDLDRERADLINFLVANKIPVKPLLIIDGRQEYDMKKEGIKIDIPIKTIECGKVEEQMALL